MKRLTRLDLHDDCLDAATALARSKLARAKYLAMMTAVLPRQTAPAPKALEPPPQEPVAPTTLPDMRRFVYRVARQAIAAAAKKEAAASSQPDNREFSRLIRACAIVYRTTPNILFGKSQAVKHVWPRQVAMYLAIESGHYTSTQIGKLLCKDHSTILYGHQMVERKLNEGHLEVIADVRTVKRMAGTIEQNSNPMHFPVDQQPNV